MLNLVLNSTQKASTLTEEEVLVAACSRQESWAQRRLYEANYSRLMGVAMRYSSNQNDALDILHDGYLKIYMNIHKYQNHSNLNDSLFSWMRRIIVNSAIDFYRKEIRQRAEDIEVAQDINSDDADGYDKCKAEDVLTAIQELSPSYRTIFNLHIVEGFSHKEIADMVGIAESTVRANMVKARARMKIILTKTAV